MTAFEEGKNVRLCDVDVNIPRREKDEGEEDEDDGEKEVDVVRVGEEPFVLLETERKG